MRTIHGRNSGCDISWTGGMRSWLLIELANSSDAQSKMVELNSSFTWTLKARHHGIHGVQKRVVRLQTSASCIAHTEHALAFRISCFPCLNYQSADQQTFN